MNGQMTEPVWLTRLNEQRKQAIENAPKDEEGNVIINATATDYWRDRKYKQNK